MLNSLKRAGLVMAFAAGAMTVATSAEARDRYYRDRGDTTGAAVAGGVIGLALGAAIASGSRDRYYDDGYYYGARPPRYYRGYPRGYYYDRYPRRYHDDYRYERRGGWDRGWYGGYRDGRGRDPGSWRGGW